MLDQSDDSDVKIWERLGKIWERFGKWMEDMRDPMVGIAREGNSPCLIFSFWHPLLQSFKQYLNTQRNNPTFLIFMSAS
jgi:hypothetical protein